MSDNQVSIDLGSALPYLEDKLKTLFNKDAASVAFQARVKSVLREGYHYSSSVQIVGMAEPIPIFRIYQPTTLKCRSRTDNLFSPTKYNRGDCSSSG
jgi:hypothetical protein